MTIKKVKPTHRMTTVKDFVGATLFYVILIIVLKVFASMGTITVIETTIK